MAVEQQTLFSQLDDVKQEAEVRRVDHTHRFRATNQLEKFYLVHPFIGSWAILTFQFDGELTGSYEYGKKNKTCKLPLYYRFDSRDHATGKLNSLLARRLADGYVIDYIYQNEECIYEREQQ